MGRIMLAGLLFSTRSGACQTAGKPWASCKHCLCPAILCPSAPAYIYLASWANGLMFSFKYEPHGQFHEFGRAGLDHHSADHSRFVRCEEITRACAWNGSGSEGISEGQGRIQRRAA